MDRKRLISFVALKKVFDDSITAKCLCEELYCCSPEMEVETAKQELEKKDSMLRVSKKRVMKLLDISKLTNSINY